MSEEMSSQCLTEHEQSRLKEIVNEIRGEETVVISDDASDAASVHSVKQDPLRKVENQIR